MKEEQAGSDFAVKRYAKKRDDKNELIKKFRVELANLKEKRDKLNEQVRELKELREKAKTERRAKRAEISQIRERMKDFMENMPVKDMYNLQKEIESIEWEIQTTSHTLSKEKVLIDQVRILEAQLLVHRQINEMRDSLTRLRTEEEALENKARLCHKRLSDLAEQSQGCHERMLEFFKKISVLEAEAFYAHEKYEETKQQCFKLKRKQAQLLRRQLRLRKELEEIAMKKLKRGEKLSLHEL